MPAIEMLLLAGANPCAQTASGYTPLDIAKLNRSKEMVDFLNSYMVYYKAEKQDNSKVA